MTTGLTPQALVRAVQAAPTAEVAWCEDGAPRAAAVVPLVDGGAPVVAATWSQEAWARSLATRGRVVLTLTDPRATGPAWSAVAVTATPRLEVDTGGDRFAADLLDQELRKHPPARALADSPMLRRENWWYLPRLLVHLDVVDVGALPARSTPDHALLVTPDDAGAPQASVVTVTGWQRPIPVRLPGAGAPDDAAQALLFGHDFTAPDLERWVAWRAVGALQAGRLDAADPGGRVVAGMPTLRERLRRHQALRRECLRALRRAG